ncbi:MAG: hypothetical protein LBM41_04200 [Ruminococcus sp.]|nr:hypothetical protein [Ruminococcus sp.]
MKRRFIAGLLVIVLGLTGCGSPEAEEVIVTTDVTTTTETTTTTTPHITKPEEITTATTPEFPRELYEVEFPVEFSDNYTINNYIIPLSDEDYETEISPEAQKLFDDYFAFATEQIEAEKPDHPEYPTYYEDGMFHHYPAGYTTYGLVDINSDGVPEIFKYFAYSDPTSVKIYFYDLYTKALLTDEDIYGFNPREGATYFGKNEDGNLLICRGNQHSNYEGFIYIAELLIEKDTEKLAYNESFRANFGIIDYVFYCCGYSINGEKFGYDYKIPADEFETAYREFYDAIDFDVYWICGDILYHGAEETEYKGKMAYEKYLELTKMQEYLDENSSYAAKILIDDLNNDGISEAILIYSWTTTLAYYFDGEIKEITAEGNWGGFLEGGGAPLYYNKKTDVLLAESTYSKYYNCSFYAFSDGDYKLSHEYTYRDLITPWDVDKWNESKRFDEMLDSYELTIDDLYELSESEIYGIAWNEGFFDRRDQYLADEMEVTEAEWRKFINDFENDENTILLCPDNADLDFVDVE